MAKVLELAGLGLVAVMSLGFVGALQPDIEPGLSPLFWGCAAAALGIIVYRKAIKKRQDEDED